MDNQEHDSKVKALAWRARQLDAAQRPDFLLEACAGKTDLLNEVCSELSSVADVGSGASTLTAEIFQHGQVIGGRFRIIRFVAQGGMGSVYEADDLQLGGRVALKTVRSDKASKSSLERFRREVQLARQVTHRNVCRMYDLGTHGGNDSRPDVFFLTMEFLEGKTLLQRIRESSLSATEIVEIVRQVAMGLAAAHELGIVHRDLKSSNIILVPAGAGYRAVVTDFGLAQMVGLAHPPGPSIHATPVLAGTPPYMSPEQLVGGQVGPQSDLYSFGVVMFEMATRRLPFTGDASRRLQGDVPRPSTLAPDISPKLEAMILRCLERDPQNRFESAGAIVAELDHSFRAAPSRALRRKHSFPLAAAAIVTTIVLFVFVSSRVPWPFFEPSATPTFIPVTNQPGEQLFPTLSPDAAHVAYSWEKDGNSDIYIQSVSGGPPVDITADCRSSDSEPSWSPDGQRIAYRCEKDGGGISIAAADGTWDRKLTSVGHQPSWSPDGTRLVVATERVDDLSAGLTTFVSPLWIVDAQNGSAHTLPHADGFQPCWSPHGYRIAFWTAVEGRKCIRTAPLGRGTISELVSDTHMNWNPAWSADGRRIYFLSDRGGSMNLWRIQVDERSGAPKGAPEPVVLPATYVQHVSISRDGRSIAYVQRTLVANLFRIAFDSDSGRTGKATQLTFGIRFDSMPGISGDGAILAVTSDVGKPDQIFVMPANGAGPLRQITDNTDKAVRFLEPRWSPDGKRIAFQSNLPGDARRRVNQIWSVRPDGSDLTQLTHLTQDAVTPVWKPDGSELAYSVLGGHAWFLRIATLHAEEFAPPPDNSMQFIAKSWSVDGRRIAGTLHRPDGTSEGIFSYTLSDRRYEAITSFGSAPVWLRDGVRLLFRSGFSLYMEDTRRHLSIPLTLPSSVHVSDTFAVSNDDHWLIVSSPTEQANVWVVRNIR
ncbi:MAG: protein kinase [Bryobacteraceae bacterium]